MAQGRLQQKVRLREVVRDLPDEDDENYNEAERVEGVCKIIDKIAKCDETVQRVQEELKKRPAENERKKLTPASAGERAMPAAPANSSQASDMPPLYAARGTSNHLSV